jgi:hypothetical protein
MLSAVATAPPQMVRWDIDATIITKDDPANIFPDMRLGDPVRGTLMYDTARESACYNFDCWLGIAEQYEHPRWLNVVSMTIENPRTGAEFSFVHDLEAHWADVEVGDDDQENWLVAAQSVVSPSRLFTGETPVVMVGFGRAPQEVPDLSLPTELDLDDWPFAKMVFADLYFEDVGGTRLEAEIYSLTPVPVSMLVGDFNYDGEVNQADHSDWRSSFGSTEDLYADGNVDGVVDAADYVVWRNVVSQAANTVTFGSVPEGTGMLPAATGIAAMAALQANRRRSRRVKVRQRT